MVTSLVEKLPPVRGRYLSQVPLSKTTWFRVGGPADVTYKPADIEDLCFFLKECPPDIPVHIIGVGSNLLVRDGGMQGVVIRLGSGFTNLFIDGDRIMVGAGVLDRNLALACADAGIANLEFLAGIPGTIGGALRMNAGAYGSEIKDILEYAVVVDAQGEVHHLTPQEMEMSYRHVGVAKDWIFVGACFKGTREKSDEIHVKIQKLLNEREKTQPVHSRTGGSTFANPDGHKAWELIDAAGCRGLCEGGAQMSELHCNFMINTGNASAEDLENLGEKVRKAVLQNSGVELRWEIERMGEALSQKEKAA